MYLTLDFNLIPPLPILEKQMADKLLMMFPGKSHVLLGVSYLDSHSFFIGILYLWMMCQLN